MNLVIMQNQMNFFTYTEKKKSRNSSLGESFPNTLNKKLVKVSHPESHLVTKTASRVAELRTKNGSP